MLISKKVIVVLVCIVIVAVALAVYRHYAAKGISSLGVIQKGLDIRYPELNDLSASQVTNMTAVEQPVLLIDTRGRDEYDVSHLPGAIWMPDTISYEEFVAKLDGELAHKHLVFYCSVGVRSSAVAARMLPYIDEMESLSINNLEGGIFRWHNQGRPLVSQQAKTDYVHPYNAIWGELIDKKEWIRY